MTVPVLGICGFSGSGKTTLMIKLIPALAKIGIRVSVIKHAHHNFEIDYPGKDSFEIRHAGAVQTLIGSDHRWAIISETRVNANRHPLVEWIDKIDKTKCDLILVEGFKDDPISKIEVYSKQLNHPVLSVDDLRFIGIVSDDAVPIKRPQFHRDDIDSITLFIKQWLENP
jgi:molybdopterin-guanine dinucleotide biosynthesis adapter protein